MKLQRYIYIGPRNGVTLSMGNETLEVMLISGKPCELPPTHEYTQTLLAMRYLQPVTALAEQSAVETSPKTTKGGK